MRRIALVQQGDPTKAGSWSGVPAGLTAGLEAAGCEVLPINADFRGSGRLAHHLKMSWADQSASRVFSRIAGSAAQRALRATPALDGIVMIGSGYSLGGDTPIVTFEDMTVAQAVRQADDVYTSMGESAVARWKARQRRNYERSCGCCVSSSWTAKSLREDYGVPESKIHVVGLGSNVVVEPRPRDWSRPRFLFVGVDWERKRGKAVLDAFAAVRQECPEATLDLVGRHDTVEADGVTDHGLLPLGSPEGRHRYAELLQQATCLLMPSTFEPFGIAYLDAAAAGIPSVGTTVGGAPDAVGDSGRLVDPGDHGALFRAMVELADPDTASELGARARSRCKDLTWQAVGERVLEALVSPRDAR
jgi:hypothetical protein